MINSFSKFLVEEEKQVFFTFGRMNPPTIGHEKLLDKLAQSSRGSSYRVYLSQSQDNKKNPLQYAEKIKIARKMFPRHARSIMLNKKVKTIFEALTTLYNEGFANINMVVGSDRVSEFDIPINRYNGKKVNMDSITLEKLMLSVRAREIRMQRARKVRVLQSSVRQRNRTTSHHLPKVSRKKLAMQMQRESLIRSVKDLD